MLIVRGSTNNGASFDPTKKLKIAIGLFIRRRQRPGTTSMRQGKRSVKAAAPTSSSLRAGDSGRNFSNETDISNNSGPSEFPQIVVSEDRVVVTWRDATIPGLGSEIFFAQGR
jgi:hypothetical protein